MVEVSITKRIKTYRGWEELCVETQFKIGEITRIVGSSGAGKTTLLKIIAGIISPETGFIKFGAELWFDSSKKKSKPIQERNLGFVFQDYALFPNMNVEEHLQFGTKDEQYIKELLAIGEMESFRKNLPSQLSGGQQQRLAILRAMSTKPNLLLMDEPFSAMDKDLKTSLLVKLRSLFYLQGTTVLLVTHDPGEIGEDTALFYLP